MGDELGREPQYDVFADEFLDHAEQSCFNGYVDRPACLELLGDVHGGDYFSTRVVEETWDRGWNVRVWIAPLEQTCAEIAAAGFLIERVVEPRLVPEARERDPERYERYTGAPAFVAFRVRAA